MNSKCFVRLKVPNCFVPVQIVWFRPKIELHLVPLQTFWCRHKDWIYWIFWSGTNFFGLVKYVKQFLVCHKRFGPAQNILVKINLPKFRFIESLRHTAILKNLNFCANSARRKTWSRKNISWTEMKSLLTKPSNVLPFYASSQNSNFALQWSWFLET